MTTVILRRADRRRLGHELERGAQADDRADEIPVFARGLEGFAPLVERSRYAIAEGCTAVVSEQVLLRPRATVPLAMTRRVYV